MALRRPAFSYLFPLLAVSFLTLGVVCGDALWESARAQAPPRRALSPGEASRASGFSSPFVVVIDPGHGGQDAGSRGALLLEKDFTLRASRLIAALLSKRPDVKVVLTREADTQMSAAQRAAVANYNGASLFLTLHADASWRSGARGARIMVAAPRRPPRVKGEAPEAVALRWQRSQNVHLAANRRFALGLQRRFAAVGQKEKLALHILPVRNLEGAQMPAVYLSLGVISTPEEEARLSEMDEEDACVVGVVREILRFAKLSREPPARSSAPPARRAGARP